MSKPWFLNIALNSEPSPLSVAITKVLQGATSILPEKHTG